MKKTYLPILLVAAVLSVAPSARATSFLLNDFSGNLYTASSTLVGTTNEIRFGFFAGGFTPTVSNYGSWLSNFTGVSGYFDGSTPEWSAAIDLGDNALYPVNTQLSVIAYNVLDNVNPSTATQAAIFTDTAWKITASAGADPTQNYFAIGGSTSALVGSITGGNVYMAVIPEPSTLSLTGLGLVCLMGGRRSRSRS
jgi:hypothetical protein